MNKQTCTTNTLRLASSPGFPGFFLAAEKAGKPGDELRKDTITPSLATDVPVPTGWLTMTDRLRGSVDLCPIQQ